MRHLKNMVNNQKGFANIILVVVIVIIAGVGGYFAFVKKSEPVAQQPTPTPTQTKTPVFSSPTPKDETANWKTYTTQFATFKYPPSWQVKDDSYDRNGFRYPLFHITSPDRFDLQGYNGVAVHYLIQISVDLTTNEQQIIADFAKTYIVGDQSAWNTNLSKQITQSTDEYKIGQQIISTFEFKKNY